VLLALGPHSYDVIDRALVVGILGVPDPGSGRRAVLELARAATRVADEGADVVEVGCGHEEADALAAAVAAVAEGTGCPVAVHTARSEVASAAFGAGAAVGRDPSGFADPGYLGVVRSAGGAVIGVARGGPGGDVVGGLAAVAAAASAAGLSPERVAVEPAPTSGVAPLRPLPPAPALHGLGVPVLLSLVRGPADEAVDAGTVAGALSVAVVRGCRLLRVAPGDVRAARRVVDVLAAVLGADR